MSWQVPISRTQVNRAGDVLRSEEPGSHTYSLALLSLANWRSAHSYPLNTFQGTLRSKLAAIDSDAIVAQRLKRAPSIIKKLQRFPQMQLARMQDIGGLRAVVCSVDQARALESSYTSSRRLKHELLTHNDYMACPKSDGYRGIHLVYRYQNALHTEYDGLRIELQIRTSLQHAWATAVETMGIFLDAALKSDEGPERWKTFFALAGSAFAYLEDCPPAASLAGVSRAALFSEVARMAVDLQVEDCLRGVTVAFDAAADRSGYLHLIVLNYEKRVASVRSYGKARTNEANAEYAKHEHRIDQGEQLQVALVSAGPIGELRRAYPNYFGDTHEFIRYLGLVTAEAEDI